MNWKRPLRRLGAELERQYDATRRDMRRVRRRRPACIAAYRGFGTDRIAWVRGRVLRDPGFRAPTPRDRWWTNLRNTIRMLESDEIPHARVRVRFRGALVETVADEEGHFEAAVEHRRVAAEEGLWEDAVVELADLRDRDGGFIRAQAPVMTPLPDARFGVITDMDDTVLRTDTTRLVRMTLRVLFGNAYTRLPFPGIAEFYRALLRGGGTSAANPFFYVSSSPWNLYDVLEEFLRLQRIPLGPMFLRDWGFSGRRESRGHRGHKLIAIRRLMTTYPDLPFILIGDTGQQDPEIYTQVVHDWPDRVLAVYIRDVSRNPTRTAAVEALARELAEAGTALVLSDDTDAAVRHAAASGFA